MTPGPRSNVGTGAGATVGTRAATTVRRTASAESKAWKGAVLQIAREGRAVDLVTLLADLEASGDTARHPEETDFDDRDFETENAVDAEVELSDEDDPTLPGWDDGSDDGRDPPFVLGKLFDETEDSVDLPIKIELTVVDDQCRIHRPEWMRARALTDRGQELLDEIGNRFNVLGEVGEWLSRNRKDFLRAPDPWLLGVEALAEMRRGYVSVSPGSFLELTELGMKELGRTVSTDQFSRYRTDSFIVWNDGTVPLDFIFDSEARMAWVANAVRQFAAHQGNKLTESLLEDFRSVTVPREQDASRTLLDRDIDQLEFAEFISRANRMAQTKWADVIAAHRQKLVQAQ